MEIFILFSYNTLYLFPFILVWMIRLQKVETIRIFYVWLFLQENKLQLMSRNKNARHTCKEENST